MTYSASLERIRALFPAKGFHFGRPLVFFQSDDWGRVGVRDREGLEELRSAGISLGERPYDFYSLETAEDVFAIGEVLRRHQDSIGRHPCLQTNFVVANLDFDRVRQNRNGGLSFVPLADGLPRGWNRPNLTESYHAGVSDGLFHPALHGITHFCRSSVERNYAAGGERQKLLKTLWKAGTPYIHWRMPWVGYEYWDPEQPENERFAPAAQQKQMIGEAVGYFAKMFSRLPHTACAPAYRANNDTHRAWAQHGIRVAQNGPGAPLPPHFDRHGLLHLFRTVEFEPAVDPAFSVETSLRQVEAAFRLGLPAVVSVHSINFHSTVRDFRSATLSALDEMLAKLEHNYPDLLYLHDQDLYDLVNKGSYTTPQDNTVNVKVLKKNFTRAGFRKKTRANG